MQEKVHHFIIEGERESGNYTVYEIKAVYKVKGNKGSGIKECRQFIGNRLHNEYNYPLDKVVPHQCVKPDREEAENPWHRNCTVQDYLDGIDPAKKK